MKVDRATADDVFAVALNMRERDFEEFTRIWPFDARDRLAHAMADRYGGRDDVLCGFLDGRPVCIGGTLESRPGVITLLFFATDEFPKIALPITRFIRRELFPRFFAAGVHRIEAVALASYVTVHGWLRTLGLQPETGPLKGYGKGGEAFIQFSKVVDVRPAGG